MSLNKHQFLIILILGFTPLLWFSGNNVVLGHDAGLTLLPIPHFYDRLFVWTARFAFGSDQTYAVPGFFIHGLEALIGALGFGLQDIQKIIFSFWFILPGITMFIFASQIEKRFLLRFFALPTTVFYMFNHFLLQGWFIAERTKFSLYAAAPLLLLFLFDWSENRRSALRTAIYISITFFFLNGLASLPLFGGIILIILVFTIYYFVQEFSIQRIKSFFVLILYTGLISALLQSYWLIPLADQVINSYTTSVEFYGGVSGILEWIKYVSENSSYVNLFRLQGIPEWYQNPSHPYSNIFLNNPLAIAFSYILPVAAFSSLLLFKGKIRIYLIFFAALSLISILFSAGAHPPFGSIYIFLVKFLPGFIAFRTPFYKFASSLWLSYAILIGFTVSYFYSRYSSKRVTSLLLSALVIFAILIYSYPFFNGSFFDYITGVRSMRVDVPNYVFEYGKWSEKPENSNKRVLVLPPQNLDSKIEAYEWGYWSLSPLTSLLTNTSHINSSLYMSKEEDAILSDLYRMIENQDPNWKKLAIILGIDRILVRHDFDYSLAGSPTVNPKHYTYLSADAHVIPIKTFGKWEVYDLTDTSSRVISSSSLQFLQGGAGDLSVISSLDTFDPRIPVYITDVQISPTFDPIPHSQSIYIQSECIMCNLQWKFIDRVAYIPTLTRGSFLYPLITRQENSTIDALKNDPNKLVSYYALRSFRHILGVQKMVNEHKEFEAIHETLNDYDEMLKRIQLLLNSNAYSNAIKLELLTVIRHQSYTFKEIMGSETRFRYQNLPIEESFKKFVDLQNDLESKVWRTKVESEKRLTAEAPVEGDYNLMVKNDINMLSSPMSILINENSIQSEPQIRGTWLDFGVVQLKKGENRIQLDSESEYILRSDEPITLMENKYCIEIPIKNPKENSIYRLSFVPEVLAGSGRLYIATLKGDESFEKKEIGKDLEELDAAQLTELYDKDFLTNDNLPFTIMLCNYHRDSEKSEVRLTEVAARKITVPTVILTQTGLKSESEKLVEYTKVNNTKYHIHTKNNKTPFFVIFNDSFHSDWQLDSSKNHFKTNGYGNGWYISNTDANDLTLQYKRQNLLLIGGLISIISFITILLLLKRQKI